MEKLEEGAKIPKNVSRYDDFEFINSIKGGVIPNEFIPAVEKGVKESMERGVLAGYKMVNVSCELTYGSYHDVDSSEMAFKIAGSMAFQDAAKRAKPVLLEPVMNVEVIAPEESMGDIMGDLSSRRGRPQGRAARPVAGAGREAGHRRLRHRLLVAELHQPIADQHPENRPRFHHEHDQQSG